MLQSVMVLLYQDHDLPAGSEINCSQIFWRNHNEQDHLLHGLRKNNEYIRQHILFFLLMNHSAILFLPRYRVLVYVTPHDRECIFLKLAALQEQQVNSL